MVDLCKVDIYSYAKLDIRDAHPKLLDKLRAFHLATFEILAEKPTLSRHFHELNFDT
jgi:hypothetical protein